MHSNRPDTLHRPLALLLPLLLSTPLTAVAQSHGDTRATAASREATPAIQALRGQSRHTEALLAVERRLAADPGDDEAWRLRALVLSDLGASRLAAEAVAAKPALFPDHERERLQGDAVARAIGWGTADPVDPRQRLAESRAALQALEALERDHPRVTNWERTRLRVDALSALNHLQRHQDVVDGYAALRAEGIEVPGYILATVGDSLLALRRPEDAVPVLDAAIAHQPGDVRARILLGYAWLELERFDRALPVFEALAASQEAWPRQPGATGGYENWDRYSADVNLALARSHGNDHATAAETLHGLVAIAPRNGSLHAALGAVEQRRGHPTAALERYDMALTLEPWQRDGMAGRVGALLALDRVDAARDALAALQDTHPEDPRLDRVARDVERHRGWQATVSASRGRSEQRDGDASLSPLGSRDGGWAVDVRSPLLDDRWRIGVLAQDTWADFAAPAGGARERVRYRSAGLGAYYRHDRLAASVTASRVRDDADRGATAWTVSAHWRFDDAWRAGVSFAHLDPEASLQARRLGITADSLSLTAGWAPDDTRAIDARLSRFRYDDGNVRDQLGVDGRTRLITRPHLLLDGLASAYTSRASRGDETPYFNPERDASAAIGLRLDHITWRHYETAFQQRVEVTAGPYWQRGQSARWVPTLGYRHLWRRDGHELEYGVSWARPVYDGVREDRVAFDVELRWGGAR